MNEVNLNQLTPLSPFSFLGPVATPSAYLVISRPVEVACTSGTSAKRPMSWSFASLCAGDVEKAREACATRGTACLANMTAAGTGKICWLMMSCVKGEHASTLTRGSQRDRVRVCPLKIYAQILVCAGKHRLVSIFTRHSTNGRHSTHHRHEPTRVPPGAFQLLARLNH